MVSLINYFKILYEPGKFYHHIKKNSNTKNNLFYIVVFPFIIYIFWFLRILFLVNNHNVHNSTVELYKITFGSFNIRFIYSAIIMLLSDIIVFSTLFVFIAIISMLICKLFNLKLKFNDYLLITIYAAIPYIISTFIYLFLSLINLVQYQKWITTISYIWFVLLIYTGVRTFSQNSPLKLRKGIKKMIPP